MTSNSGFLQCKPTKSPVPSDICKVTVGVSMERMWACSGTSFVSLAAIEGDCAIAKSGHDSKRAIEKNINVVFFMAYHPCELLRMSAQILLLHAVTKVQASSTGGPGRSKEGKDQVGRGNDSVTAPSGHVRSYGS